MSPRNGFYAHLAQADLTSSRRPECEDLPPTPLYSVCAEVHLYPDQQDVVIGQRCSGAEITNPPPEQGWAYAGSWIWTSGNTPSRHFVHKGKRKGRSC